MKPQLLKVSKDLTYSFSARRDTMPDINNRWHYHPEIELIFFKQGSGTQFIGDNISRFQSGDLMIIGADLPHYWKFDDCYFEAPDEQQVDVCVVHFTENFWGDVFLNMPENKEIKRLLEAARLGIKMTGPSRKAIGDVVENIIAGEGARKLILLLEVLHTISNYGNHSTIASVGFKHNFDRQEKDKINAIYNYSITHFKKTISLSEIAAVANVSPHTFCRYFKSKSRRTYSYFLKEIRIGHACKLLIEDKLNIKEICFESGFNNLASFHKAFKEITRKTPLSYQKSYTQGSDIPLKKVG
ncbi:AraC family transcriptional regulator [Mucilaginibacter boryungensis]|uniref:AraC family transcriptional regulator n=1 Tax=Mucilaginibacter boryungensis TaxID=768480 RepID=A0ABR9XKW5_9SPHI|nr:AraC family transcriptional regulator [Mucilaginibacter boryungensis]MBE9668031.1 AraC family transcriptional regulator [Mucilaginibacter boryungensis]